MQTCTMTIVLTVHGRCFPVAKKRLVETLFEIHPELYDQSTYEVKSDVPVEIWETFLSFIETEAFPAVMSDNASSLLALSQEFGVPALAQECDAVARVSSLEHSIL
jgi:hypothetical protein